MSELSTTREYAIVKLKAHINLNGRYIVATLTDYDTEWNIYLPKRTCNALDMIQIEALNEEAKKERLGLRYFGGKFNKFEFFYMDYYTPAVESQ